MIKKNVAKILMGNWKMHGSSQEIQDFLSQLSPAPQGLLPVLCFPFPYLSLAHKLLPSGYELGAQDISGYGQGAYTGQVSASMVKDSQAQWVLVGHCEHYLQDPDAIHRKIDQALSHGLTPVVCFSKVDQASDRLAPGACLAYEPAVGANALSQDLEQDIGALKATYGSTPLFYGGSVNAQTLETLCDLPLDGFLVGRASLTVASWQKLLEIIHQKGLEC